LDSGFGGCEFEFGEELLPLVPVPLLPELLLLVVEVLDKSGEKRPCMEGSRCCCEAVAFVLVLVFGSAPVPVVDVDVDVDRRPWASPRWLAVILVFSVDDIDDDEDDDDDEAPRNSSQEESPVDSGSSSSSSSPLLDVSPVSGGGKSDEYDCFGFWLPVSNGLVLDFALFDSLERSGEDPPEAEAEVVAADDASSCAL
jgi:hypothetical protein